MHPRNSRQHKLLDSTAVAENRITGGVGEVTGAIPLPRPDCAAIAVGLLQFIAIHFQYTIWSEHCLYLRTQSRDLPSEKTVKQIIAPLLVKQFFRHGHNCIIQQIRVYLMTVSDEIDDN